MTFYQHRYIIAYTFLNLMLKMPKKNIHPDYHTVYLVFPNGKEIQTKSTFGKEGDKIHMDMDPAEHPAWTGKAGFANTNEFGKVASYNKKYAGLKV